jgi:ribosomal protein L24E
MERTWNVGKVFRTAETVNKSSKTARLALALLRDRERPSAVNTITACFLCDRSYTYRGPNGGDDSGRFCSGRCRENYDAGKQPQSSSPQLYSLRPGKTGFFITCAGCAREFESRGLKFCQPECERQQRQRAENQAVMAEVGMEPTQKRRCEKCGRAIPRWRDGRAVSKAVRFCSQKCQRSQTKRR